MDFELRRIQLCQLDLALEVKRICEKYEIKYFLIGGTLLGAVRHGGFIPWDDDLDIGMLRNDYDRFINIAKEELNKEYFLQTNQTDRHYGFGFAKIKINNTIFLEEITRKNNTHKGIFIDIFPFDNMPDNIKQQKWHSIKVRLYRHLLLIKCRYLSSDKNKKYKQIIMNIVSVPLLFITKKFLVRKLVREETRYNNKKTINKINLEGSYKYREHIAAKLLDNNLSTINFENISFYTPNSPELYLKNLYGDYLKLPPIDKRQNRHGIVKIDFGNYVIRNKNLKSSDYILEDSTKI
ncbi:LicD family protein [Acholeplasma granularum]|uniref:LicD family protein n=1 Tax=Acholeplasma granularum TaxID=264635 RepID=UPI0004728F49|nr:LicD family protein [Acholeplasma granularum]